VNAVHRLRISAAAVCGCVLVVSACRADSVATINERIEGALAVKDGQLTVGDKAVAWNSVSYIVRSDAQPTVTSPRLVRFKNGEIWSAEISGLISKKLTLDSPAFGAQRADVALVASIEFVQSLESDPTAKPATLYREKAQPIPGEILWIDREKLALSTALGALTLQRDGLTRYVFSTQAPEATDTLDELALRDGSIFKGKTELSGTSVELTHGILGKLSFPLSALRYVLRASNAIANIRGFSAEQVQVTPLISTRMVPEGVRDLREGVWGVRIWPHTVAKIPLPEKGEKIVFRALLSSAASGAGNARVRVSAGGKYVLEKVVAEKSEWINVEIPKAKELEIDVDFAGSPRFPADVMLREPQLIVVPPLGGRD